MHRIVLQSISNSVFVRFVAIYERTRKRSYHIPGIHIECGGTNSVNHCIMKLISYFQVDFSVSCIEIVFRIPCHVIRELRTR